MGFPVRIDVGNYFRSAVVPLGISADAHLLGKRTPVGYWAHLACMNLMWLPVITGER